MQEGTHRGIHRRVVDPQPRRLHGGYEGVHRLGGDRLLGRHFGEEPDTVLQAELVEPRAQPVGVLVQDVVATGEIAIRGVFQVRQELLFELRPRDAGGKTRVRVEVRLCEHVRVEPLLHLAREDLHVVRKADHPVALGLVADAVKNSLQAIPRETGDVETLVLVVRRVEMIDGQHEVPVGLRCNAGQDLGLEITLWHADGRAGRQAVPVGKGDPDALRKRIKEKHGVQQERGQDEHGEKYDDLGPRLHHDARSLKARGGRSLPGA